MTFNLRAIIAVADRATRPLRTIGRAFARFARIPKAALARIAGFSRAAGIPRLAESFREVGRAAQRFGERLKTVVTRLTVIGAAGVAAVGALIRSFARGGDEVAKLARRLGVGVDELQEYIFAAERSGVASERFNVATRALNQRIADAASGRNQEAADLFRRLGIELTDGEGALKNWSDIMPELADGFQRNTNATLRNRMAIALFEAEGTAMINMLHGGAEGLRALVAEARRYGVMSDDQTRKAERLTDSFTNIRQAWRGMTDQIGASLAPIIRPLIDATREWIIANRDLIAQNVARIARDFAAALQEIDWREVGRQIAGVGRAIKRVVEFVGGWRNALVALLIVLNAGLIVSLGVLTKGLVLAGFAFAAVLAKVTLLSVSGIGVLIGKLALLAPLMPGIVAAFWAWAAALTANPIGLIVVGIAALVAGAVLLIRNWDAVANFFSGLWNRLAGAFERGWEKIKPIVEALKAAASLSPIGLLARGATALSGRGTAPPDVAGARRDLERARQGVDVSGGVDVNVRLSGAPPGTRVETRSRGMVEPEVDVGMAMVRP